MIQAVFFVVAACGFSWGLYYGLLPHIDKSAEVALLTGYMFGPLVAGVLTTIIFRRGTFIESLALRFRFNGWWIAAWLAPPLLAGAAFGVALLAPGAEFQNYRDGLMAAVEASGVAVPADAPERIPSFAILLGMAMVGGILPNSIAAFGEEAGWRGVMWTQMRPLGFWKASVIVGLVWGLWHAPVIMNGFNYGRDYAGFPWLGVAAMAAFCILLTPFMGLMRDRTGSVFPAAIFHGTVNAVAGVFALNLKGVPPIIGGFPGLAGMIVLAGLAIVVMALRPNRAPVG